MDHTNTPSLPSGQVLDLVVDREGTLWVRMQSPYLVRYSGGTFQQMYPEKLPPPFSSAREQGATAITRGIGGNVLIATPGAPLRYVVVKFTRVVTSGGSHGIAMSIAETQDGTVWVGTRDNGLLRVRDGRAAQVGSPDQKVNVLLPGASPELWIGTDSGLAPWNGSAITRSGVAAALARSPVRALARDRDSNLWVSTTAGITRLGSNASSLVTTGSAPGVVHAIFEDREGNLWFGGIEGLMQLRDAPFLSYS